MPKIKNKSDIVYLDIPEEFKKYIKKSCRICNETGREGFKVIDNKGIPILCRCVRKAKEKEDKLKEQQKKEEAKKIDNDLENMVKDMEDKTHALGININ